MSTRELKKYLNVKDCVILKEVVGRQKKATTRKQILRGEENVNKKVYHEYP
jgi:hypothetical protein